MEHFAVLHLLPRLLRNMHAGSFQCRGLLYFFSPPPAPHGGPLGTATSPSPFQQQQVLPHSLPSPLFFCLAAIPPFSAFPQALFPVLPFHGFLLCSVVDSTPKSCPKVLSSRSAFFPALPRPVKDLCFKSPACATILRTTPFPAIFFFMQEMLIALAPLSPSLNPPFTELSSPASLTLHFQAFLHDPSPDPVKDANAKRTNCPLLPLRRLCFRLLSHL